MHFNIAHPTIYFLSIVNRITQGSFFGESTTSPLLGNIRCTGNEANLLACPYDAPGTDCGQAGLVCNSACPEGDVRLNGGTWGHSGRVEICHNNVWG